MFQTLPLIVSQKLTSILSTIRDILSTLHLAKSSLIFSSEAPNINRSSEI